MPSDGSPHFNSTADCTFALNNLPDPDEPRFTGVLKSPHMASIYCDLWYLIQHIIASGKYTSLSTL